jgi:ribonuclease P protein component
LESERLSAHIIVALKRALRLRKNTDFQRVRQHGRSTASRLLILMYAPNNLTSIRIGFVVSKRTSKLAVERNYIKRLLAEAMHSMLTNLPAGWDIVISAKHTALGVPLPAMTQDLRILLRRVRLLDSAPMQESRG